MKAAIEVQNREEAVLINNALSSNPTTRVLILVLGALAGLPKPDALRVLKIATEQFGGGNGDG